MLSFFYKKEEETIQFNDGFATSSLQKKREQVREPETLMEAYDQA